MSLSTLPAPEPEPMRDGVHDVKRTCNQRSIDSVESCSSRLFFVLCFTSIFVHRILSHPLFSMFRFLFLVTQYNFHFTDPEKKLNDFIVIAYRHNLKRELGWCDQVNHQHHKVHKYLIVLC